jgi:hypothetical protein
MAIGDAVQISILHYKAMLSDVINRWLDLLYSLPGDAYDPGAAVFLEYLQYYINRIERQIARLMLLMRMLREDVRPH